MLAGVGYSDRTIRLLTVAPLAVLAAGGGVQVAMTATFSGWYTVLLTTGLMTCYLPLVGYQAWSAAHLRRPRGGGWMLGVTAVIVAIGLALIGDPWKFTLVHLLASAVIVLPRRWAVPAGCMILAAVVPIDLWLNPVPNPLWTMVVIVQRAGAVLVPTWFAGVLRELRATREILAEQAVLRERIRIDDELTRTVGDSLHAIADRGAAAATLADADPDRARGELRALVDSSRRTLAGARRLIRAYRPLTLRAELDTAMALLSAAGVPARLALPEQELPRYADPELREALRAAVERLLAEQSPRTRVIALDAAGRLRLTVAADGTR